MDEDFKKIACDTNDLKEFLKRKALNHRCYKYYSSFERVWAIKEKGELYLSNGDKWNDVIDRERFANKTNGKTNFGKCFSFSVSENVAMWMLYGDFNGRGGMIDLKNKDMDLILAAKEIEVGYFDNNDFITVSTITNDDSNNKFDIYVCDMFYCGEADKENPNQYYIKRSDQCCKKTPKSVIEDLDFYRKNCPWQYENECRLIVSVDNECISDSIKGIKINLGENNIEGDVYLSPNYSKEDNQENTEKAKQSSLYGKIKWSQDE